MKKHEIKIGGKYRAKVGNNITTVRVDLIREYDGQTRYDVTNLVTQRKTTFRSAAKFRSVAVQYQTSAHGGRVLLDPLPDTTPVVETTTADDEGNGDVAEGEHRDPFSSVDTSNTSNTSGESPTTMSAPTPSSPPPNSPCGPDHTPSPAGASTVASTDATPSSSCETQPTPGSVQSAVPLVPAHTSHMPAAIADAFAQAVAVPPRTRHSLTDEQRVVVETAPREQVLVIEAGAGTGKTSTLVELTAVMPGRGQYTAFNASLVAESKSKFDEVRCPCNTIHSLAFRSEGRKFAHRLGGRRVMASEVAAMLGVQPMVVQGADGKDKTLDAGLLTSQAARAVKTFCQSADGEVGLQHFGSVASLQFAAQDAVRGYMLPFAARMWLDAQDPCGTLPYTHDFYVKRWQLNDPTISADYVLLDEAQDTSPVMLDVLAQQVARGTRVILVGDSAQQIYSWRGAVNALAAFPDAKRLYLSQSFRFGQVIAEVANAVLGHLQDKTALIMRGFDKVQSRLASVANPTAVLCRTNAMAVQTLLSAIAAGKRPHLIGGGDEVLKFVHGARDLQGGRRTNHPELAAFDSWGEVKTYSATEEGEDLKLMVKLVDQFGADKIAAALKNMPAERDAQLVVSTCHKSKGREWDSVRLANDFMPLNKMGDEELRLLYVAATRAKLVLDLENCAPFCGGSKEMDGLVVRERVIDIKEARRLSKELGVAPASEVVVQPATAADTQKPAYTPRGERRESPNNTWTKSKRGEWLVRGKPGQAGTVTVERRNGSKSQEKLGKVVWQDSEVALYEVVGK